MRTDSHPERLRLAREIVDIAANDRLGADRLAAWIAQRADLDGLDKLAAQLVES